MSSNPSVAASLPPNTRQKLGIGMMAKTKPVSQLAAEHQVSRKFVYQQGQKAKAALRYPLPRRYFSYPASV
jgi:hypothetical protein